MNKTAKYNQKISLNSKKNIKIYSNIKKIFIFYALSNRFLFFVGFFFKKSIYKILFKLTF